MLSAIINRGKKLSTEHLNIIRAEVTKEDVQRMIFNIPDDKASSANGYNNKSFKHIWDVIGDEVL